MQALIQQYQEDYFRRRRPGPHGSEDDAAPKADEITVTLTLTAPPSQPGQRPTILFSETRHLPPRDEEESLNTVVGRLLRQASHSTIHITRLPLSSPASRAGSNHPYPVPFPQRALPNPREKIRISHSRFKAGLSLDRVLGEPQEGIERVLAMDKVEGSFRLSSLARRDPRQHSDGRDRPVITIP